MLLRHSLTPGPIINHDSAPVFLAIFYCFAFLSWSVGLSRRGELTSCTSASQCLGCGRVARANNHLDPRGCPVQASVGRGFFVGGSKVKIPTLPSQNAPISFGPI